MTWLVKLELDVRLFKRRLKNILNESDYRRKFALSNWGNFGRGS